MDFGPATYGLALLAGMLSTLSPCVLPLIPVLVATAVSRHRWGAVALGVGLAVSFTVVGLVIATASGSLGLDPDSFRTAGALVLMIFGIVLVVPQFQELFAKGTSWFSASGNTLLSRISGDGIGGQFLVGSVLGVVWSPCVGPTLGAATTLASQSRELTRIALLMLVFGMGAAAPLVLLGSVSRKRMMVIRGRLLNAGRYGKQAFGIILLAIGTLIVTHIDKSLEAWILDRTPQWLVDLTTHF